MNALSNLDAKSFQIFHWYEKHQNEMTCPIFKFKIYGRFRDALTRQLTEAILILDSGGLNKKCEFRVNEICRMEAKPPKADMEKERKLKESNEEQESKNIQKFIEKIREKQSEDIRNTDSNNSFIISRKRVCGHEAERQEAPRKKRKKVENMESSTPKTWRQGMASSPPEVVGITPIKPYPESPDTVPTANLEGSEDNEAGEDKGRTFMSNELRGSRISPLKLETQEEEEASLYREVSMLYRSSTASECIAGNVELVHKESSKENVFYGAYRRKRSNSLDSWLESLDINQLDEWSQDSLDRKHINPESYINSSKIILGSNADKNILSQPATPSTPGAVKRDLVPGKSTPTGRPRKFSSCQMASPSLRRNLVTTLPDEYATPGRRSKVEFISCGRGVDELDDYTTPGRRSKKEFISCGRVVDEQERENIKSPRGGGRETPVRKGKTLLLREAASTPRKPRKYVRKKGARNDSSQIKITQLLKAPKQGEANGNESDRE